MSNRVYDAEWIIRTVEYKKYDLLLSDRPLVLIGLSNNTFGFILPIAPNKIFAASDNPNFLKKIREFTHKDLIQALNISVVQQAKQKAFGSNKFHQLRFFERLGAYHSILPFAKN